MQVPVCRVHVAGQNQEVPMRLNSGYKLRKTVPAGAYVQTFALLLREGGTFPSVGRECLVEQRQRVALGFSLAYFAPRTLAMSTIATAAKGWHEACRRCWVHIGSGEGDG